MRKFVRKYRAKYQRTIRNVSFGILLFTHIVIAYVTPNEVSSFLVGLLFGLFVMQQFVDFYKEELLRYKHLVYGGSRLDNMDEAIISKKYLKKVLVSLEDEYTKYIQLSDEQRDNGDKSNAEYYGAVARGFDEAIFLYNTLLMDKLFGDE